jgi:hypothetical protein
MYTAQGSLECGNDVPTKVNDNKGNNGNIKDITTEKFASPGFVPCPNGNRTAHLPSSSTECPLLLVSGGCDHLEHDRQKMWKCTMCKSGCYKENAALYDR